MTGATPQPAGRDDERPPNRAPLPDWWWRQTLKTRQQIAAALVIGLVLVGIGWFVSSDREPTPAEYVADMSADRVMAFEQLAECESESQWDLDSGNGFFGGLQFKQSSWEEVGGTGSPADASKDEQIMRGDFLQKEKGWSPWPGCSAQLGLS